MPTARPIVVDDVEVVDCWLLLWLPLSEGLHVAVIVVAKMVVVGVDIEMVEEAAVAELIKADCAASLRKGFPITTWNGRSSLQQRPVWSASQQKVLSPDE